MRQVLVHTPPCTSMRSRHDEIRVAIQIGVLPGESGGVVASTAGLVKSLGQLDGPETYVLAASSSSHADWIEPYAGSNQRVEVRTRKGAHPASVNGHTNGSHTGRILKHVLRPGVMAFRKVFTRIVPAPWPSIAMSDGYYEGLACDVLHFPTQAFELVSLPTIFNPHDLQHLHYPQFFKPYELAVRETIYPAGCHFAQTVVVGSEWIKQDVVKQYGVNPDKVQVIPWASPCEQFASVDQRSLEATKGKYHLPESFMFYPAVAWAHKNHLRLLEALALLRDSEGIVVNLICTGARYESFWPRIEQCVEALNLRRQVRFLGFVPEAELRAIYRLAQFLVLPSLFEADSCPIHEAWTEGLAVASSNIPALAQQVSDAGLLFDPTDVSAIASAIAEMAANPSLREDLVERGRRRVKDFDWERTAKAYRAVYRRAAGSKLSEEDRWLLSWDWMRHPRRVPEYQTT